MLKLRIAIAIVLLLSGLYLGQGAGFFTALLVLAIWGWVHPVSIEPTQELTEAPSNNGELVPARRGKPDPTRPNRTDENAGRITERIHRGNS
jgi:hypothetical protein